jgi:DeoR/GlpR family transcriptional regulator of sugar metabolism
MEKKLTSSRFLAVGDLADVDILITTTPIPEFTKSLKDKPG